MDNPPIVLVAEQRLHSLAVWALLAAAAYRLGWGYLSTGNLWLNDCQLLAIALAISLLLFGGCFVPLPWSYVVSCLGGGIGWLVALSLLPPLWWSQYALLRSDLPDWLVLGSGLLVVFGIITRATLNRHWLKELAGHGFKWMLEWAKGKPYYARLTAKVLMANLGYRG